MKKSAAIGILHLLVYSAPAQQMPAKRKPGDPLQHLPANIQVLTQFGESDQADGLLRKKKAG